MTDQAHTADVTTAQQPVGRHPQPPALNGAGPIAVAVPPEVPEDVFPQLKAQALADSGCDEVRVVTVDGIDHEFVLRRPTKREWDDYYDGACDTSRAVQAARTLASKCCLWPSRFAHIGRMQRDEAQLPALPMRLCDHIERWVGWVPMREIVVDADADGEALASFGIPPADAEALLAQYPHRGQLKAVAFATTPADWPDADRREVCLVVKRPEKGVFESFLAGFAGAKKAAAAYDFAVACIVRPATDVARLLNDAPGIPAKLHDALVVMGGAGARTSVKKR